MDDRDSMWSNKDEKLRAQGFFRRHLWKITTAGSLVLMLIFALIAFSLLLNRSTNTQVITSLTPGSNQQATATAHSLTNATPTIGATDTATAVSTPQTPTSQALPCSVNIGTWTDGSSDWKVLNGMLLNDGTNDNASSGGPSIIAPCQLGNTANYAVGTKIQVIKVGRDPCFGITVRGNPASGGWQGYKVGIGSCACCDTLSGGVFIGIPNYPANTPNPLSTFNPGLNSHTYRVEVKDNTIKFFIDGGLTFSITDNSYLTGSEVGLWCQNAQLSVTSFQVTAL
jgi:hypothetical protein